MRILLVNKFWYPKGGSERYAFLLKDLLESKGHEVIPFGGEDNDVVRKPLRALWNRRAARRIDRFLTETRPDIAHLQNFSREISPSILPVLRRHDIPIVWTLHDLDAFRPGYRHPRVLGRRVFAWAEYTLHQCILDVYRKHVDVIIAPSRFAADAVRVLGWRGRVEVVPNFIAIPQEHSNAANPYPNASNSDGVFEALGSHSEHSNVHPVLFVGRLVEEKGILDFLKAARRLPEIPFEVIGDGPNWEKAQSSKLKAQNLKWLGSLPPEETARRIAGATIVVVPSTIPEIAPYVILEAMAAGVPVVASRIGGIPELVRDGETGVLVPPQDPTALAKTIEMVYRDEVQRRRFGERARAIAIAEYGPERHYERLIVIYEELRDS